MSKTDEDVRRLSVEARQVWESPLVRDFMQNYVMQLFTLWLNEPDQSKREELWFEARAVDGFKNKFLRHMAGGAALDKRNSGKIAEGIGPII